MTNTETPAFFLSRLDPALVAEFDSAVTAQFSEVRDRVGGPTARGVDLSARVDELGLRLLGSRGLTEAVVDSLFDGPDYGDVLSALDVLEELGVVGLSPAVLRQVRSV